MSVTQKYSNLEYRLGKLAYMGYCEETGGVSLISGDKLPGFDALKPQIQDAWATAAMAVAKFFEQANK